MHLLIRLHYVGSWYISIFSAENNILLFCLVFGDDDEINIDNDNTIFSGTGEVEKHVFLCMLVDKKL